LSDSEAVMDLLPKVEPFSPVERSCHNWVIPEWDSLCTKPRSRE
jgi:hypothetical protein